MKNTLYNKVVFVTLINSLTNMNKHWELWFLSINCSLQLMLVHYALTNANSITFKDVLVNLETNIN